MSCLDYMCLCVYSCVQRILCCVFVLFFFVLCALCCQFLWIFHFLLHLRYSLTFSCLHYIKCCQIQIHKCSHRSLQFHATEFTCVYISTKQHKPQTTRQTNIYLLQQSVDGMASKSQDLNPIEHFWN